MNKSKYIQVVTTVSNKSEGNKIAGILVEKELAACVQILGPIESVYTWKEKIERSREWLCIIKTIRKNYLKIEKIIKENHSYDLPEIIIVPIVGGNKQYLKWMDKMIK